MPNNPFLRMTPSGRLGQPFSVGARINAVQRFTRGQCIDALALDDEKQYLQSSVRAAILLRFAALEQEVCDAA